MKKIFLFFTFNFLLLAFAYSQIFNDSKTEIGIDEHLGKQIPLNLKFCNEKGDSVTLAQLIDKATVLSFVYFDCPGLCSPLQHGISDVIDNNNLELGKDYKVITISFNYKDDPKKADKKKKNFATCISKNKCIYWTYLTTDSVTINRILASVGFKIKVTGVDFSHPSGIVIVSPKGVITRYLYGVSFLPLDFKMAIIEAQKGISRPTVSKILSYCFAYDPQGRKYKLEVTKISGTVILFLAFMLLLYAIVKPKRKSKTIDN
jgi:protein SCO1